MPTLTWQGKDKIINHHRDIPFYLLDKQYSFQAENDKSLNSNDNLIINGDNLLALKSLLPQFGGRVNCIYIDPPYNTGNESWVYNDNVNDPRIQKWLGEVVGKEGEDFSRHDKWLCMMYPRLQLLKQLLAQDGVIFISIDDNEQANLKLICDEIFGYRNFIANFVWKKKQGGGNDSNNVVVEHEYIFAYAKNIKQIQFNLDETHQLDDKLYPFSDENGNYGLITLDKSSLGYIESLDFEIKDKNGNSYYPRNKNGEKKFRWRWGREKVEEEFDKLVFKNGKVYTKSYRPNGVTPKSLLVDSLYGRTETGKDDIKAVFNNEAPFSYPKPIALISHFLSLSTNKNAIILDSFLGSGTTAHAVLSLNKKDGGSRRFIGIEMMNYAETITAERVRRVINGYGTKPETQAGTGGGFSYYTIGSPLFDGNFLNPNAPLQSIREYMGYSVGLNEIWETNNSLSPHILGIKDGTAYVFFYLENEVTTLDLDFLKTFGSLDEKTPKPEMFVIYADKLALSKEQLEDFKIIFRQIPRDISRF